MKIKLVNNEFQFRKTCKKCGDKYWTSFLIGRICFKCKYKNNKIFKK